ncbi:hypothetical protein Tco_0755692 [Tanacetum coccineum]
MQEKLKLSKSQGASTPAEIQRMQNIPYASAVGLIMYAVRCTRPDVAFTQNIASRFQQNPGELHWTTVKNILKYLRNTKDMFLVYGGAVVWKSTKQSIFSTSSTDAEYIAAFDASKEAVWIHKFIYGLGVVPTIEEPINMYCENTGAIAIAKDHGVTKGARHFRAKVYYLRETIEIGDDLRLKGNGLPSLYYASHARRHEINACHLVPARQSLVSLPQHRTRNSGPDLSFDITASPECMPGLSHASSAEIIKLCFSFGVLGTEEKSLIYNTSFLDEYECSSLALDRGRRKVEDEIGSLETRLNYVSDQEI